MSNGPETTVTPSSSNISSFTWDPDTDTLTIEFQSGESYDYMNVPASVHRAFQRAGSYGAYFIRHIKGRFAYEMR